MAWFLTLLLVSCASLSSPTHLKTIVEQYKGGRVEEARRSLQGWLEASPPSPQALYWASILDPRAGASAQYLQELLSEEPAGELAERAAISLGINLYSRGLYLSAQKALNRQFADPTHKVEGRYWLGRTLLALNHPDSARASFHSAASSGGSPLLRGLALIGIGDCYLSQGEYSSALREYEIVQDSLPLPQFLPQILWKKALCLEGLGKGKEAERYYSYILNRFPTSWTAQVAGKRLGLQPEEERFSIQLGAFRKRANAQNLKLLLVEDGYQAWLEKRGDLFVVLVGSFEGREEAQSSGRELEAKYKLGYRIIPLY